MAWTLSRASRKSASALAICSASRRALNSVSSSRPTPRVRFWIISSRPGVKLHLAPAGLLQRRPLPFLRFLLPDDRRQLLLLPREVGGHLLAGRRAQRRARAARQGGVRGLLRLKIAIHKLRWVVIRRHMDSLGRSARGVKPAQNKVPTARPRTLNGPWSSRPSVALSSFCKLSLAFL